MAAPTYSSAYSPVRNLQLLLKSLASTVVPETTFATVITQILHRMHATAMALSGTFSVAGATTLASVTATSAAMRLARTNYTADGAIALTSGVHVIAKTSAAAMTVAAPSSVNGTRLVIVSNSDFAHVITFTGSTLLDGTTGANLTVTMTALKGSCLVVIAEGATWLLESSSNVTSITA